MSSFTDCEGETCWAAGWLQHSYTVSNNLAADTLELVAIGLEGPLTSGLSADSFPKRAVPFHPAVIGFLFVVLALTALHEIYAVNNKPILANHEKSPSVWVQLAFMAQKFQMSSFLAMTVPVSLDYTMQMGESATMSGFWMSSPMLAGIVGVVIGTQICPESDWNQALARRVLVNFQLLSILCVLANAYNVNDAGETSLGHRRWVFWLSVILLQAQVILSSTPLVPMMVMQNNITPNSEKTFWAIFGQCAQSGGMLFGPGLYGVLAYAVKSGQEVSPASLLGWVYVGIAILQAVVNLYISLVVPSVIHPLPEEPVLPEAEVCVTMLPETQRESVVKNMVWFGLERNFSLAAIEVGTIMLLEVSYHWPTELCGLVFTVVSATSLIFSAISSVMMSAGCVTESSVFFAANFCSLVGVIFLFDFGTGPAGLLIADGMVYGMATVCNGISEGWASKAAVPDTSYSVEAYRVQSSFAVIAARFLSPIVTRTLMDFGGRNVYATMQFVIVFLGTLNVYKTVKMVWDSRGAQALEKAGNALKLNEELGDDASNANSEAKRD